MKKVLLLMILSCSMPALSQTNIHFSMLELLSTPAPAQTNIQCSASSNPEISVNDELTGVIEEIRAMSYVLRAWAGGVLDDELKQFEDYALAHPEKRDELIESLRNISDHLESSIKKRASRFPAKERSIAIYRNSERLFKYDKEISEEDVAIVVGMIESNMTMDPRIRSIRRKDEEKITVMVGGSQEGKGAYYTFEKEAGKWVLTSRMLWVS